MDYPKEVTIVEVGPRDGLQNEPTFLPTPLKIDFINQLSQCGLEHIEVTSFVSPKAIPQLADGEVVFKSINKPAGIHFSVLVPNEKGMQKALSCGAKEIAVFTAASETFNQRNIRASIAESIERFKLVVTTAKENHIFVRAYISCALGCPYEGAVKPEKVANTASLLLELGVDEICLGDTIGVGTPKQTRAAILSLKELMPATKIGMHFHDTYGQAVANVLASLELDIRRFDAATAGLGGCPYARGATGNVATEDLLYLMHGLGIKTGVDIYKVTLAGDAICKILGRKNQSKVATALLANG